MKVMMEEPLEEVEEVVEVTAPVIEAKPEIEDINLSSDDLFAITNSTIHLGEVETNILTEY